MEQERISLSNLVSGYTANVRSLERDISTLQADAEELTSEVDKHKEAKRLSDEQRGTLERQRASLQGERQSLMGAHAEATFTSDTAEIQRISRRRVELDKGLKEVNEDIRSSVVPANDLAERAAALRVAEESVGERLPKQHYSTASLIHPMLESISKVLHDDAQRLREMYNVIKVPAASKEAVEEARRQRGVKATADPAWLVEQERKRQERLKRFEGVQGSTDAMHEAMTRSYREPQPRAKVASGDESGVLSGDEVRAALAAKSA